MTKMRAVLLWPKGILDPPHILHGSSKNKAGNDECTQDHQHLRHDDDDITYRRSTDMSTDVN